MPGNVYPPDESLMIAELQAEVRRLRRASAASLLPIGEYDKFTLTSSTDAAHTLSYLPATSLIPIAMLNGNVGDYGTDYTVNFATGVVTWSAVKVAGDVLGVFYQTTGLLKVYSMVTNVGSITDNFNRANSSSLGTATTGQSWAVVARGTWGISGNVAAVQTTRAVDNDAISWIDTGNSDGVAQMTFTAVGGGVGLLLRASSTENFWVADTSGLVRVVNNVFTRPVTLAPTLTAGTVVAVTLSGNTFDMTANGTRPSPTSGTLPYTDSFNATATKHGIYGGTGTQADDWSWSG